MRRKSYTGSYKGKKKTLLRIVLAVLLAGLLAFAALEAAVVAGMKSEWRGEPDIVLILGAQVKPWGPSVLLADRLETALAYLEEHPELPVAVSGGQGDDEPGTEAAAMRDYLIERGIDPGRILLEDKSRNTAQNMEFTAALLEGEGYDLEETHLLVVSNGFHLTRARLLAGRCGLDISTLEAPCSDIPSRLKMFVREPLALAKSILFDLRN